MCYIIRSDADIDLIFDIVIKLIWLGVIQDSGLKTPILMRQIRVGNSGVE